MGGSGPLLPRPDGSGSCGLALPARQHDLGRVSYLDHQDFHPSYLGLVQDSEGNSQSPWCYRSMATTRSWRRSAIDGSETRGRYLREDQSKAVRIHTSPHQPPPLPLCPSQHNVDPTSAISQRRRLVSHSHPGLGWSGGTSSSVAARAVTLAGAVELADPGGGGSEPNMASPRHCPVALFCKDGNTRNVSSRRLRRCSVRPYGFNLAEFGCL